MSRIIRLTHPSGFVVSVDIQDNDRGAEYIVYRAFSELFKDTRQMAQLIEENISLRLQLLTAGHRPSC